MLFKKLKAAFVEEERDKEDQILEQARIKAEKEKERQERLASMLEEKIENWFKILLKICPSTKCQIEKWNTKR